MKKRISVILAGTFACGCFPVSQVAAEQDNSLWERFLRFDLCVTDYNELSEDEQALCRFIFDAEQGADDNIICERARRELAGDNDLGERLTLDKLAEAAGVQDKYSSERIYGWQAYIHCVPDVIRLDGDYNGICEYWLDDAGSSYVVFNDILRDGDIRSFDVFDKDGNLLQNIVADDSKVPSNLERGDIEKMKESGFIEKNGGYYYIKADGTAVFAWCELSKQSPYKAEPEDIEASTVIEPFEIESEINGAPVVGIESYAFSKAPFAEIIIPDTVETIDGSAFYNCRYLENIVLPKGLKYLGANAFMNCTSLEELKIDCPELKLEDGTFKNCDKLKSMELNVREIGERSLPPYLEDLKLGDALEKVDATALMRESNLAEYSLPVGTKAIEQGAFRNANDKSVVIPPTVKTIGAFPRKKGNSGTLGLGAASRRPLTDEPICAFASDCTLYGYSGTEAERYAAEWNLKFIPLDYEDGDVNLDGGFGIADVVTTSRWLLGNRDAELVYWVAGDLCEDGKLDGFDLCLMRSELIATGNK